MLACRIISTSFVLVISISTVMMTIRGVHRTLKAAQECCSTDEIGPVTQLEAGYLFFCYGGMDADAWNPNTTVQIGPDEDPDQPEDPDLIRLDSEEEFNRWLTDNYLQ